MSASKSIMPRGTRQAALIALCLAVCLFAWRGSLLLTGHDEPAAPAATPETQALTTLLEPVLGRDAFRIAMHTRDDGTRSVLILVDAPQDRFHMGAEIRDRIETILVAATGFDPARDSLQVQPFAFAPGTRGGVSQAALMELGALGLITMLLGLVVFTTGERRIMPPQPAANDPVSTPTPLPGAELRTFPMSATDRDVSTDEIRQLARKDPKRAASIIKSWMNDGGQT